MIIQTLPPLYTFLSSIEKGNTQYEKVSAREMRRYNERKLKKQKNIKENKNGFLIQKIIKQYEGV
jgi:hypothetical protein